MLHVHSLRFFRRHERQEPQPLRIGGVAQPPLTPEPDEAELAAEALLDVLSGGRNHGTTESRNHGGEASRSAEYYRHVAERVRFAREFAEGRAARFLAWAEDKLKQADVPVEGPGGLQLMEAELYKRLGTVERAGGDLKMRWQHCLAEVTRRLFAAEGAKDE